MIEEKPTDAQTPEGHTETAALPQDFLDILVCPLGKKPLRQEKDELVCTVCGVRYKISDGIPIMLIEEATLPDGVSSIEELECYSEGEG